MSSRTAGPEWKAQQKILWAEARKETGRGGTDSRSRDLLADSRCSQAVLDSLSTTETGRGGDSGLVAEDDARSEGSECEPRERRKWGRWTCGLGTDFRCHFLLYFP